MPAFDMDQARVQTIKKLKKKLARYEQVEIEKMVEDKWDEATEKIASQLATALKENEKLKKQKTKKLPAGFVMIEEKSFDKVAKDLMKVSEEKKQLEIQLRNATRRLCDSATSRCEVLKKATDDFEAYEKEMDELKEEYWEKGWNTGKSDTWDEIDDAVKPLKEEITKLKAEIDDAVENHFADLKLRETTHKEWDTLQEELLYYKFYAYTVGLLDDLTKEDVDNFTDSKVQRKTLYDAIGYDD